MNASTTTEYVAPLSSWITRIASRLAPSDAKSPTFKASRPEMEIFAEVHAGQLTRAHIGRTISLRDGARGKIQRVEQRTDVRTGRAVTDITTDQGFRTYGAEKVVLLVDLVPVPIPRAATGEYRGINGLTTAEFLAEQEAAAEAKAAAKTPRQLHGYFAGLTI
jgi:hypothetical protein